jgi:hypothetical protein
VNQCENGFEQKYTHTRRFFPFLPLLLFSFLPTLFFARRFRMHGGGRKINRVDGKKLTRLKTVDEEAQSVYTNIDFSLKRPSSIFPSFFLSLIHSLTVFIPRLLFCCLLMLVCNPKFVSLKPDNGRADRPNCVLLERDSPSD